MVALDRERWRGRLEIVEVNRGEGFPDVKFARLTGIVDAIPVVDPVSGVGVLLNLGNHKAGADGVESTGRNKQCVTGMDGELVEAGLEGGAALFDGGFKLFAGDATMQTGNQCGDRRGIKDVPHFGFGFAAELRGDGGRWVDLE